MGKTNVDRTRNLLASVTEDMLGSELAVRPEDNGIRVERILLDHFPIHFFDEIKRCLSFAKAAEFNLRTIVFVCLFEMRYEFFRTNDNFNLPRYFRQILDRYFQDSVPLNQEL